MTRTASRHFSKPSGATLVACGLGRAGAIAFSVSRSSAATGSSACAKASSGSRRLLDRRGHGGLVEQHLAHRAEQACAGGEPADGVERGRHVHRAAGVDPAMRGADAVEPAERGRHAHRAAGVGAEREIACARRGRRRRSARRAAGNAPRRAQVRRRAVMRVHAGDAVEELVGDRLADDACARCEQLFDGGGVLRRGLRLSKPVRVAGAGLLARDGIQVLHRGAEARRAGRSPRP